MEERIINIVKGWVVGFDGKVTKELVEEAIEYTIKALDDTYYEDELREELNVLEKYLLLV